MDERQALHIYRTMQQVRRQFGVYRFNNDRYSDEVRPYMMDDDNMEEMEFDFTPSLEKMIKDMMMGKRSSSHNNNRMSNMESMMKYKKEEEQEYNPFKSSSSYRYKRQALEAGKRGRMPGQARNDGAST